MFTYESENSLIVKNIILFNDVTNQEFTVRGLLNPTWLYNIKKPNFSMSNPFGWPSIGNFG